MTAGQRLGGREFARAASFVSIACRDELALIVFVFRASHSSLAERGSDSVAPGRQSQLCCYFALSQAPFTPLPAIHSATALMRPDNRTMEAFFTKVWKTDVA